MTRAQFRTPGVHTISAEAGGDRASLQLTVVTPSLKATKVGDVRVPGGLATEYRRLRQQLGPESARAGGVDRDPPESAIGAAMRLNVSLTPMSVSFANLDCRERICDADAMWGYWATHRSRFPRDQFAHRTHEQWTPVTSENLALEDLAGEWIKISDLPWPLAAGGYQYPIPVEYRIIPPPIGPRIEDSETIFGPLPGSGVFRFDAGMSQTMRFDPDPGCTAPPFHGTFTIWKGGCWVVQRY